MASPATLPFSTAEFFSVFERYNTAVWPAQTALLALALACVAIVAFRPERGRTIGAMLALLWAWTAIAYHFAFFAAINTVAWGFGGLGLVAAALFAWHALRGSLTFGRATGASGAIGAALVGYALIVYPVLGEVLGEHYPAAPTFGLPCPTTIFTLGMLLFARRPVPRAVFVVPLAWAVVGGAAAFQLGVRQDLGLPVAAVAVVAVLIGRRQGQRARAGNAPSLRA